MVTRKPVPPAANIGLAAPSSPPYPMTPSTTTTPAPFQMQDVRNQFAADSDTESDNAWEEEAISKHNTGNMNPASSLPSSLRIGPAGYTPKTSQERLVPSATNPFLQRQNTGSSFGGEQKDSSAGAWGASERPAPPSTAPPPPPVSQGITPLHQQLSNLSVAEPSSNPWQPHLDTKPAPKTTTTPLMSQEDSGKDAWKSLPAHEPSLPSVGIAQSSLLDLREPESPAWDEDEPSRVVHEMPGNETAEIQQIDYERHAWDDSGSHRTNPNPRRSSDGIVQQDGWDLTDHTPSRFSTEDGGTVPGPFGNVEHAPYLPPRPTQEFPPPQPPRPLTDTATNQSSSSLLSPTSNARNQKKETYEIKRITWHDMNATENPRVSPILVQNANGPCPLLALVNALTLSTPADVETALVETLRSREQVSLGLLLDAVFDELMSGRRGDAAQELPDVGDLYAFLITLHTGMNVNPRFFPPPPSKSANDPRNSMSHVHPSEREHSIPGTFEETREMKLYSTFSVPLIHGWLPDLGSPAFSSLQRAAQSYEDAQNLFFREEELEEKLGIEGLNFEEQSTLQDIATIKSFFNSNATQLTPHGLDTITTSVAPGAVAILFRNDHFSTLYRHPGTLQLLQLVTDMGYAGHEEVVWESLIDVTGENAEFFSGDFRLVGGASPVLAATTPPTGGWVSATGRQQSQNFSSGYREEPGSVPIQETIQHPQSPNTEQEDHDLALALQLQEEEEDRHRAEVARRQRETELSQQYIEQQGRARGNIPVSQRGGGAGRGGRISGNQGSPRGATELRPAIPPRRSGPAVQHPPIVSDPEAGVDAPPPSYEQAANQAAYLPPANHPAHPNSSPNGAPTGRRLSAYSTNTSPYQGNPHVGIRPAGRRGTVGPNQGAPMEQISGRRNTAAAGVSGESRDRDCIVM